MDDYSILPLSVLHCDRAWYFATFRNATNDRAADSLSRERSRHLYVLSYLIFNVQTLSSLLLRIIFVCEKEEERFT